MTARMIKAIQMTNEIRLFLFPDFPVPMIIRDVVMFLLPYAHFGWLEYRKRGRGFKEDLEGSFSPSAWSLLQECSNIDFIVTVLNLCEIFARPFIIFLVSV